MIFSKSTLVIAAALVINCPGSVNGLVWYDNSNRTSVSTVSAIVTRLVAVDTTFDTNLDVLVGTEKGCISIRRSTGISFQQRIFYNRTYVKGNVEAIGYLRESSTAGVIVTVNSRDTPVKGNIPNAALALVREPKTIGGAPTVVQLISSTSQLQGPAIAMTEVNGRDVQVVDMNKDGYPDIVATVSGKSTASGSKADSAGFLLLLLNDGKNNFKTTIIADNLNGKAVFGVGDIDQNGYVDIAVLGIDSRTLTVFYQERDNTFTAQLIESNLSSNYAITVGLFNNADTGADIFTLGSTSMTAYLPVKNSGPIYYRGFTRNRLFNFDPSQHLSSNYRDWQIRLRDMDADGLVDIVMIYGKQTGLKWMKQYPNKALSGPANIITAVGAPTSFDVIDMNKDGILDIVIYSDLADKIYMYLGKQF